MWFWIGIISLLALVGLFLAAWFRWNIVAWTVKLPQPRHRSLRIDYNVIIPMRDGVNLVADVYRPKAQGRYPALVIRTPYEKGEKKHQHPFVGRLFASQGYVCIIQDTRGKHQSEGDFYPFAYEDFDGFDTVQWVANQDWSNGNVGMFGISYLGLAQWLSAPLQNPHLRAMVPIFISQRAYDIVRGQHGVLHFRDSLVWQYSNVHRQKREYDSIDWDKVVSHLPVISADEAAGEKIPAYKDWVQHSENDGYWSQWRVDNKVSQIKAPALVVAGWFDRFLECGIDDFLRMRRFGGSEAARASKLIVGPWVHEPVERYPDINFGRHASGWKLMPDVMRWYERWVKGINNGVESEPPIKLFVMGINEWRYENEWPLARTEYRLCYLHSRGKANSRHGNGALNFEAPGEEEPDQFYYDPLDPVPTVGGNSVFGAEHHAGPMEQVTVEQRQDVLVYTSEVLEKPLEVTGPVKLILYAATSAVDTDFTAKLVNVYPCGKALQVKAGIVRARYRKSLSKPELLQPGKIERYEISIGPTSTVFMPGHRLRLQVSSSNFPEYSRNLNVEDDPHHTKATMVAEQTIFHDAEHPSHLLLPVIPEEA